LQSYESTDYLGIYGVEGFGEGYTLTAMNADDYLGFVYALSDNEDTIVYVEILFCNYHTYLDYTEYIPNEYLPIGFDATDEMTYVEGGFKLDYSWLMRTKVGCLAIARNEISRNSLTVIKDKELAAEIYTHAFLYYNPAGALVAMGGLGLEAYDKSILGVLIILMVWILK